MNNYLKEYKFYTISEVATVIAKNKKEALQRLKKQYDFDEKLIFKTEEKEI